MAGFPRRIGYTTGQTIYLEFMKASELEKNLRNLSDPSIRMRLADI